MPVKVNVASFFLFSISIYKGQCRFHWGKLCQAIKTISNVLKKCCRLLYTSLLSVWNAMKHCFSCLIFMALDQSTLKLLWTNYVILSLVICTLYSTNKWKMNFIWNWSSRCIYWTCTLLVYGLEKQDVDIWLNCYWK